MPGAGPHRSTESAPGWFSLPSASVDWAEGRGPESAPLVSLAIGMFDGVHRGHHAVLSSTVDKAAALGARVVVLTFRPHPSRILRPDQPTAMLFDDRIKAERLFAHGVDAIIWKSFDPAFASVPAADFATILYAGIPGLRSVHVGENFRFGAGRRGSPAVLQEALADRGVEVVAVPRMLWKGEAISSTRVREALRQGGVEAVNDMLAEPYRCDGTIVGGKRLGRSIGYPTLNLAYDPECRPTFGVYVVRAQGADGVSVPAVANYGLRPTVEDSVEPRLEVHVLAPIPDCWVSGAHLRVDWLSFLRPETRFEDLASLKAQIDLDVNNARHWFQREKSV